MLPKVIPKQDLLDNWLKQVQLQNSIFAKQRSILVADQSLIDLRGFFQEFFGEDFFIVERTNLNTIDLKVENSNWFFQLLANDDYPSLVHLYEVARLLQTSKSHHGELFKKLQSLTQKQNFRDYLFEAVINEMLRINNTEYQSKVIVAGKEREGFLWMDGTKCLFECKKLYSYQLPGIGFIFSLQSEFFRKWQKRPFSLDAYISAKPNTAPAFSRNKQFFLEGFDKYLQQVWNTGKIPYQEALTDPEGEVVGELFFEPNNEPIFRHQLELIKGPAVCFRVNPAKRKMINDQLLDYHSTELRFKFDQLERVSMEYLLEQIRRKRQSQRDMNDMPRIFFFDNEIYRGFEFPMFPNPDRFTGDEIQRYVESKETDDIICIVFREYGFDRLPRWIFKVFCKPSLNHIKSKIESWKTLYQQGDFLTGLPRHIG